MAELTGFGYHFGRSPLHRMDVRVKMACLVLISMATLGASPGAMAALSALVAIAVGSSRVPFSAFIKNLRYPVLLLLLVFVARALTTPGSVLWGGGLLTVTSEGVRQGGLVCWRLGVVLAAGCSLIVTTLPAHIKAAVEWFLKPVPWLPEKRVATMISLIVRFIPVIFDTARQTMDAQRARCVESRKNPVSRLVVFAVPMMRRTFSSADRLALAMEARCYNEDRTPRKLTASPTDGLILGLVFGVVVLTRFL